MRTGIMLIVLGVVVILVPVASYAYRDSRDREHVAEFYQRNSNAAVLPSDLRPAGYGAYDAACFVAGSIIVLVGIFRSRPARVSEPA